MQNKTINLSVVEKIAKALKSLNDQIIFVGGSVISLYTDDPAADEIRPTADIDLTVNLFTFKDWTYFQTDLAKLGFLPNINGHSINSYIYKNTPIDFMLIKDSHIGVSNSWFESGFKHLWKVELNDQKLQVLSVTYFLATKFEAFNNRATDYRTSHDFEDIIYIIDNRISIVEDIKSADRIVRDFVSSQLFKLVKNKYYEEILSAHIHPLIIDERMEIVKQKIAKIIS